MEGQDPSTATSFNPRTPCGVRRKAAGRRKAFTRFQSTHSLRSATRRGNADKAAETVSIHALLAECDWTTRTTTPPEQSFQSTHSLRSATLNPACLTSVLLVSIHALLAECDGTSLTSRKRKMRFQSTHSLRSATRNGCCGSGTTRFQSTHSLRSATYPIIKLGPPRQSFNPRTPCGVRRILNVSSEAISLFQSTHSLRSATVDSPGPYTVKNSFNPRTPCGVRRKKI